MQKNVAGQKWVVYAYQGEGGTNPGEPVTGDATNITANLRIDGGAANAVDDLNPTELEDGFYVFDITAAESNGESIVICPVSATLNVNVVGAPAAIYTTPANFPDMSVEASTGRVDLAAIAGTPQTGNDVGNDVNVILSRIVGTLASGTHTAQTGDSFAIVNSGTFGNAAIETLVDELETRLTAARAANLDELGAANIPADIDTLLARIVGTLASGTHTAQTGDSFARIGANGAGLTSLASASALATVDANVDTMVAGIITGAAATGTLTTGGMTTNLTGYTADQLIGRLVTFTSGVVDGEQTEIEDYVVTNGEILYPTGLTTLAPGNGDTFKIT